MNGKTSSVSQNDYKQLQEQTNQRKTFVQDIFNINYVNNSKIYYQPSSNSSDVKVNNYLCYQEGENLYKITEIIYEDKLIRIEDKFEVNVDADKMNSTAVVTTIAKKEKNMSKNMEKIRIFSKDVKKNGKVQKKDKKNIVKNIVKIFISWLQKKQSDKQSIIWDNALSQVKKMLEAENFNNRLIKNIVGNKNTSKAFLAFLTDDADDEIKYSRIQDKQSHYEAIELYISLLSENVNGKKMSLDDGSRSESQGSRSSGQSNDFSMVDGSPENQSQNLSNKNERSKQMQTRNASSQRNSNSHLNHTGNHISHVINHVNRNGVTFSKMNENSSLRTPITQNSEQLVKEEQTDNTKSKNSSSTN